MNFDTKKKRYCASCGKEMTLLKEPRGKHYFGGDYSPITGELQLIKIWQCPTNFLGWHYHPSVIADWREISGLIK